MGPLVETTTLYINAEARTLHLDGLENAFAGRFHEAQDSFGAAQEALQADPLTVDQQVQQARIDRDTGFTLVRMGIAIAKGETVSPPEADTQPLDTVTAFGLALVGLSKSRNSLERQLTLPDSDSNQRPKPATPAEVRRSIHAELGATLTLLGRMSTVGTVLLMSGVSPHESQQYHTSAHRHLLQGDNGYYLTNNASTAARDARANHRPLMTAAWTGHAVRGLAWTATNDPRHLMRASETAANHLRSLRSVESARAATLKRP